MKKMTLGILLALAIGGTSCSEESEDKSEESFDQLEPCDCKKLNAELAEEYMDENGEFRASNVKDKTKAAQWKDCMDRSFSQDEKVSDAYNKGLENCQ